MLSNLPWGLEELHWAVHCSWLEDLHLADQEYLSALAGSDHSAEDPLYTGLFLAAEVVLFALKAVPDLVEGRSVHEADIWGHKPVLDLPEVCRMHCSGSLPHGHCCMPAGCCSHHSAADYSPGDTDHTVCWRTRHSHSRTRDAQRGSQHAAEACSSSVVAHTPRLDRRP